jgi:signal peptidase I
VQSTEGTRIVPARANRPKTPNAPNASNAQGSHAWREIIETVLLTALVYFVVRSSVQFTPIQGVSMEPGLHDGQSVIVNQLAYVFGSPQRGDVVVFHPPPDPQTQYIKRVIAIPGDTIQITDTAIIVDGVTLSESYVNPADSGPNENGNIVPPLKLGPGEYWVMGDNRGDSNDSRVFGVVPRQNLVGKAELVIWPPGAIHWIPTYHDVFAGIKP